MEKEGKSERKERNSQALCGGEQEKKGKKGQKAQLAMDMIWQLDVWQLDVGRNDYGQDLRWHFWFV